MKSQRLQDLAQKVLSDEQAKAQFLASPENALREFRLSGIEKQAIMRAHARLALAGGEAGPDSWWTSPLP
jgi:hypothetical protein